MDGRLDPRQAVAKLRAFGKENRLSGQVARLLQPWRWTDGTFAGNVVRAQTYLAAWDFARIAKPVDKAEWRMTAPTVNASYNPAFNDITFPAGILQAPFFDPAADDAVNYGGMGAVIGHEMTHGFDDQGRQFDALGNLRDWWTPDDAQRFKDRAGRVTAQFRRLHRGGQHHHVNGRLTLGENIADLGGLKVAYAASSTRSRQAATAPPSTASPPSSASSSRGPNLARQGHRSVPAESGRGRPARTGSLRGMDPCQT